MLKTPPIAMGFDPTVLIYHENCSDGFAAAQIAYNFNKNIRLIPYSHKDKVATGLNNQNVVFIDCCYEREDLLELQKITAKILVLDHHNTVETSRGDLDFVHINQKISGARLAWNFFFPEKEFPIQFYHIEDNDLFKFDHLSTEAFCAALQQYEMTLENWNTYFPMDLNQYQYGIHIAAGNALLRYRKTLTKQFAQDSHIINFCGHKAVWCNAKFPMHSLVGNFLKESNKDCEFSICIGLEDLNTVYLSFRSFSFDVETLAKQFGGGGHRNAAGCRISFAKFVELFGISVKETDQKDTSILLEKIIDSIPIKFT